jgi:hypothetical protein
MHSFLIPALGEGRGNSFSYSLNNTTLLRPFCIHIYRLVGEIDGEGPCVNNK